MSCYDFLFVKEVLHTIEEFLQHINQFNDFARSWIQEIYNFCQLSSDQNVFYEIEGRNLSYYANTSSGEILSYMIYQYRFDEDFNEAKNVMERLYNLADQRDIIIRNHQLRSFHHHQQHQDQ